MDSNFIDYCIIDCAIPSQFAIECRSKINFDNPATLSEVMAKLSFVGY